MSKATEKLVADIIKSIEDDGPGKLSPREMKLHQRAVITAAANFALELLDDMRNSMIRQANLSDRLAAALEKLVEVQKHRD